MPLFGPERGRLRGQNDLTYILAGDLGNVMIAGEEEQKQAVDAARQAGEAALKEGGDSKFGFGNMVGTLTSDK